MENRCAECGVVIPEGRQLCRACAAGLPPGTYEKLKEYAEALGVLIDELIERIQVVFAQTKESFCDFYDSIKEMMFFVDKEPTPKTPYFFRSKTRVYDKRPHKQHRCRNNCRKEWCRQCQTN